MKKMGLRKEAKRKYDVVIIGGLGHVGLPLGISFANEGLKVCLYDIDVRKAKLVKQGKMPFIEYDAEPILKKVLKNKTLDISLDLRVVTKARYVIITVGTPIDEYLNPNLRPILELFVKLREFLNHKQIIIIRSTVYPSTCRQVVNFLGNKNGPWHFAYCPERILQGYAVRELKELPQLVAGLTQKAEDEAVKLFETLSPKVLRVSIGEAELAKLFTNAWRYIQFGVANQFFMVAHNFGVDYDKVRSAMIESYGRAASLPSAGFAAGPCLLKDTMQLTAFNENNFLLGQAAMMVNEGMPNFIVKDLEKRHDLSKTKVGILGMAFKADVDDTRDALSYKLGKILRFHGARILYSDEYVEDSTFVTKEKLIKSSDVIIIGVPHSAYKGLVIPKRVEVVDLWGIVNQEGVS